MLIIASISIYFSQHNACYLFQRLSAAFFAISARRSGVIFSARFFPPFAPSAFAAGSLPSSITSSVSSPVAMRMTRTAFPITSAGRFWPLGPVGIERRSFWPDFFLKQQPALLDFNPLIAPLFPRSLLLLHEHMTCSDFAETGFCFWGMRTSPVLGIGG
ncbi:MAG: hypothetical protein M9955_03500 [Rhizobiaceae bacterium]|nr:hypothetical protein [Rhizobiaceae bacterium]